jgi:transposase
MGAPDTMELRERVVAAFGFGLIRVETATLFRVAESSMHRWPRLDREKSSVAVKSMGGNRPFALAGERKRILEQITQQPDLPLRAVLHGRGIEVSYFGVYAARRTTPSRFAWR